jgi:hypothetical protein
MNHMSLTHVGFILQLRNYILNVVSGPSGEKDVSERYVLERNGSELRSEMIAAGRIYST